MGTIITDPATFVPTDAEVDQAKADILAHVIPQGDAGGIPPKHDYLVTYPTRTAHSPDA